MRHQQVEVTRLNAKIKSHNGQMEVTRLSLYNNSMTKNAGMKNYH